MSDGGGVGAIASIGGGLLGGSSADKAAKQQSRSAEAAIGEQRRQFDLTRQDLAPWQQAGTNALDRLQYLLGIGGSGSVNPAVSSAQAEYDAALADVQRLQSQPTQGGNVPGGYTWIAPVGNDREVEMFYADNYGDTEGTPFRTQNALAGAGGAHSDAALQAAQNRLANAQNALAGAQAQPYTPGGDFGMLMKRFGVEDFRTDPGYQFRLGEGNRALQNAGSALGMSLSGRQAKELTRYNQGFASNEYSNAWNRDSAEKARMFNFLSGTAGMGQSSAHQVANLGASSASNVGNLLTQQGNALAAGTVGASNAYSNALSGAVDAYQTNALLNTLKKPKSHGWATSDGGGWE